MTTVAPAAFWWVSPLVVAIGICATLTTALITIRTNRGIARVKTTLDMIEASESREHYQALYRTYRRFRMEPEFKAAVLAPRTEDDRAARFRCLDFLNHYELIAIGFKQGILDEQFYRTWMDYVVLRDYRLARELMLSARLPAVPGDPGNAGAYCELEELCIRWGGDPVDRPRRASRAPGTEP